MRALVVLCVIAGCRTTQPYRLDVMDRYEVGEDAVVSVHVERPSGDDAQLVITRPGGTRIRQRAPLDVEVSRIRFGTPLPRPGVEPTFTVPGTYRVELRAGKKVLARLAIEVKVDHLSDLLPDEVIADYKPIVRYARAKQSGPSAWMTYGAIYEHPFRADARIEILIEEPKDHLATAWLPYEEDSTLGVILDNNVRVRERAESFTASWKGSGMIVSLRGPTLADLERGLIRHFLARFPSKLPPE
jgi:hypothetical protein